MHTSIRAARDQVAMETIVAKADIIADRFGIPFDAEAATRHDRDPFVRALFTREALADFLTQLVDQTNPPAMMPSESDRLGTMTVPEVVTLVDAVEDLDDLKHLEQAEAAGKNRAGVFKAIEAKREDLEAAAEEDDDDAGSNVNDRSGGEDLPDHDVGNGGGRPVLDDGE